MKEAGDDMGGYFGTLLPLLILALAFALTFLRV